MSRITVESICKDDVRFLLLQKKLGLNKVNHAISEMFPIWFHCTEFSVFDILPEEIDLLTGIEGFSDILLSCRLGILRADGKIYICGSRDRTGWLGKLSENGKKGGRPKLAVLKENKPDGNQTVTRR